MKHAVWLFLVAVAACGGDDDGSGSGADAGTLENPGFARPDTVTTAYQKDGEIWNEVGPANWSCLDTPSEDMPASLAITISGIVRDFQNKDDVIADAMIEVYSGNDITGTAIATASSAADGSFSLTLDAGTERVAYKTSADE